MLSKHFESFDELAEDSRKINFEEFYEIKDLIKNLADELDQEELFEYVRKFDILIAYIRNPSEDLQLLAVQKDPNNIRFIKNPSPRVQAGVVRYYPELVEEISNPSEAVQHYIFENHIELVNLLQKITVPKIAIYHAITKNSL